MVRRALLRELDRALPSVGRPRRGTAAAEVILKETCRSVSGEFSATASSVPAARPLSSLARTTFGGGGREVTSSLTRSARG